MIPFASLLILWSVLSATQPQSRAPFVISGHEVVPGQRLDINIPIAAGPLDPATVMPVTVFHGQVPGPVLAITAGVHGYEFPPILAAQQLLGRIDPTRLSGTVILLASGAPHGVRAACSVRQPV